MDDYSEVTAVYLGDANFLEASAPSSAAASQAETTTSLESSIDPPDAAEATTFTAVVSALSSDCVPTGSVEFYNAGTPFGSASLDGTGKAVPNAPAETVPSYADVTAVYEGDPNFFGSTSPALVPADAIDPSVTQLVASPPAPTAGADFSVTAHVTGATNGYVWFYSRSGTSKNVPLGAGDPVPVNSQGVAAIAVYGLSPGTYILSAGWVSTKSAAPATLYTLSLSIGLPTTTTLTVSPSSPAAGQPVTLTARIPLVHKPSQAGRLRL